MRASPFAAVGFLVAAAAAGCNDDAGPDDAGPDAADADADTDSDSDSDTDPTVCEGLPTPDAKTLASEDTLLALVNDVRRDGTTCGAETFEPTTRFALHPALRCASRAHAIDLAERGKASHTGSDGSSYDDRFRRYGYYATEWAGDVAQDCPTAEAALDFWLTVAPNACALLLDPGYQDFGTATQGGYWVIGLGSTD